MQHSSRELQAQRKLSMLPALHPIARRFVAVEKRRMGAGLKAIVVPPRIVALTDQGVVSGTSFLTTILIGRWTTPSDFGIYSIGMSLLVFCLSVQYSLICIPYTIARAGIPASAGRQCAGRALALNSYLSILAFVVLSVLAAALAIGGATPELVVVTGVLAAAAPFAMLREFGRRLAFANFRTPHALAIDVAVSSLQLGALGWLAWSGHLSAVSAIVAVGVVCAVVGGAWLYQARAQFTVRGMTASEAASDSWRLGKWLFAGQMAVLVQSYVMIWLLAWLIGPQAAGVFAACMTIALFSNPLTIGLGNLQVPRAVVALQEGGPPNLLRQIKNDTLLVGTVMTVFCATMLLSGDWLLTLLYGGSKYAGQGHTVTVLALACLMSAVGMPASNALVALKRPDTTFWAGLIPAVISIVLVWSLVNTWGVIGAAYGFLAGNVAFAAGQWIALLWALSRHGSKTEPVGIGRSTSPLSAPAARTDP